MQIDNTSQCENCVHCSNISGTKSKLIIHCDYSERDYIYGMHVDCDNKVIRKEENAD